MGDEGEQNGTGVEGPVGGGGKVTSSVSIRC